jgi:hypothetical protein
LFRVDRRARAGPFDLGREVDTRLEIDNTRSWATKRQAFVQVWQRIDALPQNVRMFGLAKMIDFMLELEPSKQSKI